jgi:hypothetical protein
MPRFASFADIIFCHRLTDGSKIKPHEKGKREESMTLQRRDFLLIVTLAAAAATPLVGDRAVLRDCERA